MTLPSPDSPPMFERVHLRRWTEHPMLAEARAVIDNPKPSIIGQIIDREVKRQAAERIAGDEIAAVIAFARQPFWLTLAADTIRAMRRG